MDIRLSSYKRDHGLKELLSENENEFWHTDDNLPHFIEISFIRRTYIDHIELFLSYSLDDSYTPEKIEVKTGITKDSMESIITLSFTEPDGPIHIDIGKDCFFIYLIILSNHQEGRDSHVRRLRVFSYDEIPCNM
ncbi:Anaphase-promoting complex subunit 10 [Astathelohania contejeani]|uniref:Anaphase-promoting complex subunit 10 n=1 Tax=Astathelohania contejeani TaxID=164912 RepID=A0ABQ7I187_9MICR|nr:Anaphase-promoting complex subunit 10 [Thelohania contejeani]